MSVNSNVGRPQMMNLLSLDGGGIRGLASLYLLADLMQKIKFASNMPEDPLPTEYFDMIGGTNTGGIIAIMLGRLRMSVDECIKAYIDLSSEVFGQGNKKHILAKTKFSADALEAAMGKVINDKLGPGKTHETLLERDQPRCKV